MNKKVIKTVVTIGAVHVVLHHTTFEYGYNFKTGEVFTPIEVKFVGKRIAILEKGTKAHKWYADNMATPMHKTK